MNHPLKPFHTELRSKINKGNVGAHLCLRPLGRTRRPSLQKLFFDRQMVSHSTAPLFQTLVWNFPHFQLPSPFFSLFSIHLSRFSLLIPNCDHTGNLSSVGADPCVRPQAGRTRGCAHRLEAYLTSMSATWYESQDPADDLIFLRETPYQLSAPAGKKAVHQASASPPPTFIADLQGQLILKPNS